MEVGGNNRFVMFLDVLGCMCVILIVLISIVLVDKFWKFCKGSCDGDRLL